MAITGPTSIHAGDFMLLYCSSMSEPAATLTWLFNGKPTGIHEPVYVIPSIKVSDSGAYSCTAVNAVTGRNQTASHKVAVGGMELSVCIQTNA